MIYFMTCIHYTTTSVLFSQVNSIVTLRASTSIYKNHHKKLQIYSSTITFPRYQPPTFLYRFHHCLLLSVSNLPLPIRTLGAFQLSQPNHAANWGTRSRPYFIFMVSTFQNNQFVIFQLVRPFDQAEARYTHPCAREAEYIEITTSFISSTSPSNFVLFLKRLMNLKKTLRTASWMPLLPQKKSIIFLHSQTYRASSFRTQFLVHIHSTLKESKHKLSEPTFPLGSLASAA